MTRNHTVKTQQVQTTRPFEGVLWMLASGLSFVGVNSIVRALGTDIPAAQSAFIRYAFGVVFFLPMLPGLIRNGLPVGARFLVLWRGVVHSLAVLLWFFAMARIPLAHVTAIGYLSPVILMLAGALLLGEALTVRRGMAVAVAMVGTLIVLRPGIEPVNIGHLGQIGAALCFAASYLFAKKLSAFVPASVVVAMMTFTVSLGLLPLALWQWQPVTVVQVAALAVVALLATAGHYTMSRAFAVAPMTVTQPVTFLNLVWAMAMGAVFFGEGIDPWVLLGGGLIVGAIFWVTWREKSA
jgi:drug/metabolite transporter (DMT)-like permease